MGCLPTNPPGRPSTECSRGRSQGRAQPEVRGFPLVRAGGLAAGDQAQLGSDHPGGWAEFIVALPVWGAHPGRSRAAGGSKHRGPHRAPRRGVGRDHQHPGGHAPPATPVPHQGPQTPFLGVGRWSPRDHPRRPRARKLRTPTQRKRGQHRGGALGVLVSVRWWVRGAEAGEFPVGTRAKLQPPPTTRCAGPGPRARCSCQAARH